MHGPRDFLVLDKFRHLLAIHFFIERNTDDLDRLLVKRPSLHDLVDHRDRAGTGAAPDHERDDLAAQRREIHRFAVQRRELQLIRHFPDLDHVEFTACHVRHTFVGVLQQLGQMRLACGRTHSARENFHIRTLAVLQKPPPTRHRVQRVELLPQRRDRIPRGRIAKLKIRRGDIQRHHRRQRIVRQTFFVALIRHLIFELRHIRRTIRRELLVPDRITEKGQVLDHVVRPPVRRILGEKIKAGRDHLRESLLGQLGPLVTVELTKRVARQIRRRFFRGLRSLGGGCLRAHRASEGDCSQQGNNDGA